MTGKTHFDVVCVQLLVRHGHAVPQIGYCKGPSPLCMVVEPPSSGQLRVKVGTAIVTVCVSVAVLT